MEFMRWFWRDIEGFGRIERACREGPASGSGNSLLEKGLARR